jgi:pantetheine-phosphate adenylyltransferase
MAKKASLGTRIVYPGSFDPLTNGHVDVIERALAIFDRVVVGVLANPSKDPLFSAEERVRLIRETFKRFGGRVEAVAFSGLLVDFVQSCGTRLVVRGLRAISDYDYEAQMAITNRKLSPTIETIFLTASEENAYVSSSVVKQVARFGGSVESLVPRPVQKALIKRAQQLTWQPRNARRGRRR